MEKKGYWKFILSLYGREKFVVILTCIATLVTCGTEILYPVIAKKITGDISALSTDNLKTLLVILIGSIIVDGVCQWVKVVEASTAADRVIMYLRTTLFKKYNELGFSYFDENNSGEATSVIMRDADEADVLIWCVPVWLLELIINIVMGVPLLLMINKKLLIGILPTLLLYGSVIYITTKLDRKSKMKQKDVERKSFSHVEDKLSCIRDVIGFGNSDVEVNKFLEITKNERKLRRKRWCYLFIRNYGQSAINSLIHVIILIYGGYLALNGEISVSDLLVFYSSMYLIMNPMQSLMNVAKDISEAYAGMAKIMEILNTEPEVKERIKGYTPDKIQGNIKFEDVCFKYKSSKDEVLKNLNLSVKAGEFIGLVGPSGSGKSTLISILPRYYDINSGTVTIDGVNIKDYDLVTLRKSVGVVHQDVDLFAGTIYDNISYSIPDADMDDVIRVAKLANAHKFISKLPDGYNTDVGEKGVKLSGGQKQRIAIARLFLSDPSIIIFDEATSALDNESEREVQKAMEKLAKNRTTICIAHRLSTVKNVDRIIYLSDKGIEEEGSHSSLMAMNGLYAKMCRH